MTLLGRLVIAIIPVSLLAQNRFGSRRHANNDANHISAPAGEVVSYEARGALHMAADIPGRGPDTMMFAPVSDMIKAGGSLRGVAPAPNLLPLGAKPNDFTWQSLVRGDYANLLAGGQGQTPPPCRRMARLKSCVMPKAMPKARFAPLCRRADDRAYRQSHSCRHGRRDRSQTSVPAERLKILYPDIAPYVARFRVKTNRLLKDG